MRINETFIIMIENQQGTKLCVDFVVLVVTSKPGPKHDRNLALQAERGDNSMIRDCASNAQHRNQIGCTDSTFKGLPETD